MSEQILKAMIAICWLILQTHMLFYHYYLERTGEESQFAPFHMALKGTLVPVMGICWYFLSPVHQKTVIAYVICAGLGDALLMDASKFELYVAGGFFFFLSHILIAIRFGVKWGSIPWYGWLMMIPNLAIVGYFLVPELMKKTLQAALYAVYAFFLEIGACSAVGRICKYKFTCPSYWLCVIGYMFFLVSDVILIRKDSAGTGENRDIEIMGTYAVAQFLILLSMIIDPLQVEEKEKKTKEE